MRQRRSDAGRSLLELMVCFVGGGSTTTGYALTGMSMDVAEDGAVLAAVGDVDGRVVVLSRLG